MCVSSVRAQLSLLIGCYLALCVTNQMVLWGDNAGDRVETTDREAQLHQSQNKFEMYLLSTVRLKKKADADMRQNADNRPGR